MHNNTKDVKLFYNIFNEFKRKHRITTAQQYNTRMGLLIETADIWAYRFKTFSQSNESFTLCYI